MNCEKKRKLLMQESVYTTTSSFEKNHVFLFTSVGYQLDTNTLYDLNATFMIIFFLNYQTF